MRIMLLIFAVVLSGCGTKIIVPIDSTLLNQEEATVIIYHEQGFSDKFTILLDRIVAVGIVTAEKPLKFSVTPGVHELHTEVPIAIDRVTKANFRAGETYFFRVWLELGLWVSSIRVSPAVAVDQYQVVSHRDEEIKKHQKENIENNRPLAVARDVKPASEMIPAREMLKKLTKLQALFDQGLITEEEYKLKKLELLSKI